MEQDDMTKNRTVTCLSAIEDFPAKFKSINLVHDIFARIIPYTTVAVTGAKIIQMLLLNYCMLL